MLTRRKKQFILLAIIVVMIGIFLVLPELTLAQDNELPDAGSQQTQIKTDDSFVNWLSNKILFPVIHGLTAYILIPLIGLISDIIAYNGFLSSTAVKVGWPLVRDVCNMFFVIILLMIAFGTILRTSSYNFKSALPKLILMAILINFSKTIVGFIIDFGQVMMITFVNAFRPVMAQGLVTSLGMNDWLGLNTNVLKDGSNNPTLQVFGGLMLALIFTIVAVGVMLAFTAVLLYRIISLWVLVVLSPLAFLLGAFPAGSKYSGEYWSEFWGQLTTGVMIAFFLWLSFSILTNTGQLVQSIAPSYNLSDNVNPDVAGQTASSITSWDNIFQFIIAIALLLKSLEYAQRVGGFAGSFAGKVSGKLNSLGSGAVRAPFRVAKKAAKGVGWVGKKAVKGAALGAGAGLAAAGIAGAALATVTAAASLRGVGGLARPLYTALSRKQAKVREKARGSINEIRDVSVLRQIANGPALTSYQRALKHEAQEKVPSLMRNPADAAKVISSMKADEFNAVSLREITALGERGVEIRGEAETVMRRNPSKIQAYRVGLDAGGHNSHDVDHHTMLDRNNNVVRDASGSPSFGPELVRGSGATPAENALIDARIDDLLRRGSSANKYQLDDSFYDKRQSAAGGENLGSGNLSVNSFAQGKSNTIAANLVDLDLDDDLRTGEAKNAKYDQIRGVNITADTQEGKDRIARIAERMVEVVDQKMAELKAKPELSAGEQKQLSSLEQAKERFSRPEDISHLNLVNSGARNYEASSLKETKLHEETHGYGVEDERATDEIVKHVVSTRNYSNLETIAREVAQGKPVEQAINDNQKLEAVKSPLVAELQGLIDSTNLSISKDDLMQQLTVRIETDTSLNQESKDNLRQQLDQAYQDSPDKNSFKQSASSVFSQEYLQQTRQQGMAIDQKPVSQITEQENDYLNDIRELKQNIDVSVQLPQLEALSKQLKNFKPGSDIGGIVSAISNLGQMLKISDQRLMQQMFAGGGNKVTPIEVSLFNNHVENITKEINNSEQSAADSLDA